MLYPLELRAHLVPLILHIVALRGAPRGMGEVYECAIQRLERTVAIKILPSRLSDDATRRQRFGREAKAVSSLNHPEYLHAL